MGHTAAARPPRDSFPVALRIALVFRVDPAVTLENRGVRLEPMRLDHEAALKAAPAPEGAPSYTNAALADCAKGVRVPWVVRELEGGRIVGSTSYHAIVPATRRLEIGYTWYALSWQRTHVNTACKLLLMEHAFDTLGCSVVGWRTDNLNLRSQEAIERLGAKRDGVIRRQQMRRDGTARDTVMYSVTAEEWRESVRARVTALLPRRPSPG